MTDSSTKAFRAGIRIYDDSDRSYHPTFIKLIEKHCGSLNLNKVPVGWWKEHVKTDGVFLAPPNDVQDAKFLRKYRPHLLTRPLGRRRYEEELEEFQRSRPERISNWHNRNEVLHDELILFYNKVAIEAMENELVNMLEVRIDAIRSMVRPGDIQTRAIARAQRLNPRYVLMASHKLFGTQGVAKIDVLKNRVKHGIVDATGVHGVRPGQSAEDYIRLSEIQLGDLRHAVPKELHATTPHFLDEERRTALQNAFRTRPNVQASIVTLRELHVAGFTYQQLKNCILGCEANQEADAALIQASGSTGAQANFPAGAAMGSMPGMQAFAGVASYGANVPAFMQTAQQPPAAPAAGATGRYDPSTSRCFECGGLGHKKFECSPEHKAGQQCTFCNNAGHCVEVCRLKQRREGTQSDSNRDRRHNARGNYGKEHKPRGGKGGKPYWQKGTSAAAMAASQRDTFKNELFEQFMAAQQQQLAPPQQQQAAPPQQQFAAAAPQIPLKFQPAQQVQPQAAPAAAGLPHWMAGAANSMSRFFLLFCIIFAVASAPVVDGTLLNQAATDNNAFSQHLGYTVPAFAGLVTPAKDNMFSSSPHHSISSDLMQAVTVLGGTSKSAMLFRGKALIDSGAGKCITYDAIDGKNWKPAVNGEQVVVADDNHHHVTAVGRTDMTTKDSNGKLITIDVELWLVPTMEFKLMSVGAMRAAGWGFHCPPEHNATSSSTECGCSECIPAFAGTNADERGPHTTQIPNLCNYYTTSTGGEHAAGQAAETAAETCALSSMPSHDQWYNAQEQQQLAASAPVRTPSMQPPKCMQDEARPYLYTDKHKSIVFLTCFMNVFLLTLVDPQHAHDPLYTATPAMFNGTCASTERQEFDAEQVWSRQIQQEMQDHQQLERDVTDNDYLSAMGLVINHYEQATSYNTYSGAIAATNITRHSTPVFGAGEHIPVAVFPAVTDVADSVSSEPRKLGPTVNMNLHHKRMAHYNTDQLARDVTRGSVHGVKLRNSKLRCKCSICRQHKMKRASRSATDMNDQYVQQREGQRIELGDLVHCDSITSKTASIQGHHGAHNFLDHATKLAAVAPYKQRTDIYHILPDFCQWIKAKFKRHDGTEARLRVLRWDGAPEFGKSLNVSDIARQHQFIWQTTQAYTPAENADIERFNGTIKAMARCMLLQSGLSVKFWSYSIVHAVQIYNRIGHSALNGCTPFEAAMGYAPDISKFRVFGCRCWAHVPKELRTTWQTRAIPGIFLGFSQTTNGFLVWDPHNKKVLDGTHAWFDETQFGAEPLEAVKASQDAEFFVLKPLERSAPDEAHPMQNVADIARTAIRFASARIKQQLDRGIPKVDFRPIARAYVRRYCNNTHDVGDEEVDCHDEQTEHTSTGADVLDSPSIVVQGWQPGRVNQSPQQHTAAHGKDNAPIEIKWETEEIVSIKAPRGSKKGNQTKRKAIVEWEDVILMRQVLSSTDEAASIANQDSAAQREARRIISAHWQVQAIDRVDVVDLASTEWKFLEYVPNFGARNKKQKKSPPCAVQPLEQDASARAVQ